MPDDIPVGNELLKEVSLGNESGIVSKIIKPFQLHWSAITNQNCYFSAGSVDGFGDRRYKALKNTKRKIILTKTRYVLPSDEVPVLSMPFPINPFCIR